MARWVRIKESIVFNGNDARIEIGNLKIEARSSSVQERDSIRTSTTIADLSPPLWFHRHHGLKNIYFRCLKQKASDHDGKGGDPANGRSRETSDDPTYEAEYRTCRH